MLFRSGIEMGTVLIPPKDIHMSKLRRLMNRLSHGALTSVAALALTVTATNMNRCCWFIFGQDKLPDNAKKLRKF